MRLAELVEEYAKHTALNLGQALQGLRCLHRTLTLTRRHRADHVHHAARSIVLRSRRIANDLFFATIPPHWHHTREELAQMTAVPIHRWFLYGYCAWRFEETGEPRAVVGDNIDRRWDPRCQSSVTTSHR